VQVAANWLGCAFRDTQHSRKCASAITLQPRIILLFCDIWFGWDSLRASPFIRPCSNGWSSATSSIYTVASDAVTYCLLYHLLQWYAYECRILAQSGMCHHTVAHSTLLFHDMLSHMRRCEMVCSGMQQGFTGARMPKCYLLWDTGVRMLCDIQWDVLLDKACSRRVPTRLRICQPDSLCSQRCSSGCRTCLRCALTVIRIAQ
jgi:hypothetical protein